jgi:hypothetical protein
VPASVFDLGLNKSHVAARRVAELDPYLPVEAFDGGRTRTTQMSSLMVDILESATRLI